MKTNESVFDAWTISHVVTGFAAKKLQIPFALYFAGSVVYEAIEHSMEYPGGHPIFGTKRPESLRNVAGDLLAGAVGYYLAD